MHLPFDDVSYSLHASSNVNYFFMADVKYCFYEINKNNRADATHGLSLVQKIFQYRNEAMLDQDLDLY